MKVRRFLQCDAETCKFIWKESFADDDFCDMFFDDYIDLADAYVCELNGLVVGFLAVFKFDADYISDTVVCNYIYGVCVHPDFRFRGIMRKMLNTVIDIYEGVFILIPSVKNVYEKFGFGYLSQSGSFKYNNSYGEQIEDYDFAHLNRIYDIYRKRFNFSLKRTEVWWRIITQTAYADGYRIVANEGAYAFIKEDKILEIAYVADEFLNTLPLGCGTFNAPEVMCLGNIDCKTKHIALMLEWE